MSAINAPKTGTKKECPDLAGGCFNDGARFRAGPEVLNSEAGVSFNDGSRFNLTGKAFAGDVHVLPGAAGAQVGGAAEIIRRPEELLFLAEMEQVDDSNHNPD